MSLSAEEIEEMLGSAAMTDQPKRDPLPGAAETGPTADLDGGDDMSWTETADAPPAVGTLFPDWRDIFKKWPFVNMCRHPNTGEPVLILGYAYKTLGDGVRLDNAKVGSVLFSNLVSLCLPFARSNDDDTQGLKLIVIRATEGARVTTWRNTRTPDGKRTPDERHAELIVRGGKLVRLG